MKRTSLLLTITTALTLSAAAQDVPAGRIDVRRLRLGIMVAPNISWMKPTASTDDNNEFGVTNNGSKLGFTYGLMVDYNFTPNYAIATGLQVNTTGGRIVADRLKPNTAASQVQKADFDYRLSYLEVPLGLKLRTYEYSGFRFFGLLGITAGINIGKKATYTVNYLDDSMHVQTASGSNIKLTGGITNIAPLLLQMNIGAGTEYLINDRMTAFFGLFFNNGFLPDATNPENFDEAKLGYKGTFRDANTRLNSISLRLGLFF